MRIAYDLFDLAQLSTYCDSTASIRIFTRLDNPQVLAHSRVLGQVRMILWTVISLLKLIECAIC
jgi:hypothetical protein